MFEVFWANGNASWCRHTQYYEGKQVKVIEKIAFFSKILINFTSDNEMKLHIAQKISRNNMGRYKKFTKVSDFLKLHRTRLEREKKNSTRKNSFSNNCVFNSISINTRKNRRKPFFSTRKMIFVSQSFLWPLMFKETLFLLAQ